MRISTSPQFKANRICGGNLEEIVRPRITWMSLLVVVREHKYVVDAPGGSRKVDQPTNIISSPHSLIFQKGLN